MKKKNSVEKKNTLEPRQELFCREYIKDRNGTQAAIRAGYSKNSANQQASELLAKPNIRYTINRLIEKQFEKLECSAALVAKELLKTAMVDLADAYGPNGELLPLEDMPETVRKSIAQIEVDELFEGHGRERERIGYTKKVRLWDKLRALELLGKHLKMFGEDKTDNSKHFHLTVEKREEIVAGIRGAIKAGLL